MECLMMGLDFDFLEAEMARLRVERNSGRDSTLIKNLTK